MPKNIRVSPPPQTTSYSQMMAEKLRSETSPGLASPSHRPELVGVRFGWAEIISPEIQRRGGVDKRGHAATFRYVQTRCVGCGQVRWQSFDNLRRGQSLGCQPCSQPVIVPKWLQKRINAMRYRCENPKCRSFKHYGGRGVRFNFPSVSAAAEWIEKNLGLEPDKELDRIDNNGHYEPGNLRWASRSEQSRNTRRTKVRELPNWPSPYSPITTARLLRAGMTEDEILAMAALAIKEKRKSWRKIAERFASMTS